MISNNRKENKHSSLVSLSQSPIPVEAATVNIFYSQKKKEVLYKISNVSKNILYDFSLNYIPLTF